jgi:hypothetical protein
MTPGLVPNIRLDRAQSAPDGSIEIHDLDGDATDTDPGGGNVIKIENDDGSVIISLDGSPLVDSDKAAKAGWYDNLADIIGGPQLNSISDDLLRGIERDIQSRSEWMESLASGIKLLGLKQEPATTGGSADGAPVEGMSRVRHPLLLEAVLRFQANARSELLPTDGPIKVRNDSTDAKDELADALENDLNHYLTEVATEYYPDTDRMLFKLGFSGSGFKKVYYCPLRNRPVSESVDADDLIVDNSATDLQNSRRVTHKIMMRRSTLRRMQILGVYRDVELGTPNPADATPVEREEAYQQGKEADASDPSDRDHEIYECYCELDIPGFEHKHKGKVSGLEVPYRVTIDRSSREILSIVRNYAEDTGELPTANVTFVKFPFVPGFGFYDIGLLHILGNTTSAITAAWREMLDAGMFASFPGFLIADSGMRQDTNILRVPPGGGAQVKTGGMPIKDAVMPLPYKDPSPALMSLIQDMATTGMRIGGTSEQQVGEGRADAPVGTTLAMIEQAAKVLNSVHKRLHSAQAEEFKLLVECFRQHPGAFWQREGRSGTKWDEATFLKAIDTFELVPQADPNTASHGQRVMKVMALKQLQQGNPDMYDPIAIDTAALQAMGWSNPEQFFAKQPPQAKPEIQKGLQELKIKQQEADTKKAQAQAKIAESQAKIQLGAFAPKAGLEGGQPQQDTSSDMINAQARMMDAKTKQAQLGLQHQDAAIEDKNRDLDRGERHHTQLLELAKELIQNPQATERAVKEVGPLSQEMGMGKDEQ